MEGVSRSLGTSHQPQLDGDADQQCSQHTRCQHLDRGLPSGSPCVSPSLEKFPQLANVPSGVTTITLGAVQIIASGTNSRTTS